MNVGQNALRIGDAVAPGTCYLVTSSCDQGGA